MGRKLQPKKPPKSAAVQWSDVERKVFHGFKQVFLGIIQKEKDSRVPRSLGYTKTASLLASDLWAVNYSQKTSKKCGGTMVRR